MNKPIVDAVKKAVKEGSDYWALNLPEDYKDAYYGNYAASRREEGNEISDLTVMRAAERVLRTQGIRGLYFGG